MSTDTAAGPAAPASSSREGGGAFECNICLDSATNAVVTYCGHLYCWPCLYRWLRTGQRTCPVCKAGVTESTVIPLYGRGEDREHNRHAHSRTTAPPVGQRSGGGGGDDSSGGQDVPGASGNENNINTNNGGDIPNRPAAQRAEVPDDEGMPGGWGGAGPGGLNGAPVSFSAGFGFFPSLFGLQFHTFGLEGSTRPRGQPLTREEQHQLILSRLLMALGLFVIALLIFL